MNDRVVLRLAVLVFVIGVAVIAPQASWAAKMQLTNASFSSSSSLQTGNSPHADAKPQPGELTSVKAGFLPSPRRSSSTSALALTSAATPTTPFTECPAVGYDTSCGILVDVTDAGVQVLEDPGQGPYDGGDDTLVGVLNQSSKTLGHLSLASNSYIFSFDGDGICSSTYLIDPGCPFGTTEYEGPGTSFIEISPDYMSGVVSFSPGIEPGGTAYFSLEEPLTSSAVVSGGPSQTEQGGAPNRSEHHSTCSKGSPVNCATGVFWHEFTDASIPGRGVPLDFTRTYSSMNAETDGPLGFGWTDSYNMSLSLDSETGAATIHEEGGSSVTFPSNGEGGFTTPPRVLATLTATEGGTYTFSRYSDHIDYVFSESGTLLREVDRNGNTTTLAYSGGQLEKVTDPSGRSLTFSYSGSRLHTISDPMGRTTTFGYDGSGNLTEATDPMGRTWTFTYDSEHRLLTMSDPRGGSTSNTYDSSGRVIAQVDPMGRELTWSYEGDPTSPEGGTTIFTDARGDATAFDYKNLELMSVAHGYGTDSEATTSYRYDPITLGITSVTDPDGNETRNSYDNHGNLTETSDPLYRTSYYYYGSMDELLYAYNPRGTETNYVYDGSGNLLEKETPLYETGETVRTSYSYEGGPGEVTDVTDPDGHTTHFGYDSAGDRTSVTDAVGNKTTYAYNADGEQTSTVSPAGNEAGGNPAAHTTSYAYNADGELTSETDQLGHSTSYGYDGNGNRISVTDANGHTSQQTYDADNELTKVTRPDGSSLKTEWDAAGNMTAQIDAASHATAYSYDPLNRLTSMTDPNGHTTSYAYDPAGNKVETINPEGQITEYGYDGAGQLASIYYSDGTTPSVYQYYDQNGNRIESVDGTGTSTFAYDELNRMTSTTDGSGETVGYEYDLAGNLTKLTYPNGQSVARSYDAAGNLTGVTDWLGHTSHFSYDGDSNPKQMLYANGVTTQFGYDNADQLSSITDTNGGGQLASFSYTRDAVGQVTNEATENGESTATTYNRNSLDQLTAANSIPYGYDAADNPTTFGVETTQHFDPANELTSAVGPGESSETPEEPPSEEEAPSPHPSPSPTPSPSPGPGPGASGGSSGEQSQSMRQPRVSSPRMDAAAVARPRKPGMLISHPVHVAHAHDLMVVFVSVSGRGQRVRRVSGGRLRWKPVARQRDAYGDTEIWQARSKRRFQGRVAIRLREGTRLATATVAAYGNSAYIASHVTRQGRRSAPRSRVRLPDGGVIWGVGHSSGQPRASRSHASQRIVSQFFNKRAQVAGWVQRTQGLAASSSRVVDKIPARHWALVSVAIASRTAHAATASRAALSKPSSPATPSAATAARGSIPGRAEAGSRGVASSAEAVTREFAYNQRGDRIREEAVGGSARTLAYDQADRLIAVDGNITYAYNGDGLRTSKTVNGLATRFVWNQAEALPELLQAGSVDYVYGPEGRPLEQIEGATVTYLQADQQGSIRLLTNAAGTAIGRYDYDAWGNVIKHTGSAASNLQYDGQYTDAETGYQYLRSRYYDPHTGQFLSPDPIYPITQSRFDFAANNPLDLGDPFGLFGWSHFLKDAGLVVGAVGLGAAICVATVGAGCVAELAIGGASLTVTGAEVAAGATVAGFGIDAAATYVDCRHGGSRDCYTTLGQDTWDIATYGYGKYIGSGIGDAYDVYSRYGGLAYGSLTSDLPC